ncbi:MAG: hypothetical protein ABIH08_00605 [Candidatus Omnitrophota bacterium]
MTEQTEQVEQTEEKKACCGVLKIGTKLFVGIALLVLGLLAVILWWQDLWAVFRGCIGLILILAGAVTIAIAKE